jgi:methionyl-tRNA synthetase
LFDVAEAVRVAAVMLEPVVPSSSREILRRVGAASDGLNFDRDGRWRNDGARTLLQEGPLWPRKEMTNVSETTVGSHQSSVASQQSSVGGQQSSVGDQPAATPVAPEAPKSPGAPDRISIDDFMKVELRVAKVLAAEKVEKSKKLLKLTVDVGAEHRTLVAGIAEAYEPDALVGRTVVVVFNLKPAKLMGIESNGMVLAASPDGGKPEIVTFANPPEPGTRVR